VTLATLVARSTVIVVPDSEHETAASAPEEPGIVKVASVPLIEPITPAPVKVSAVAAVVRVDPLAMTESADPLETDKVTLPATSDVAVVPVPNVKLLRWLEISPDPVDTFTGG
jgi:hypothetical protein